MIPSKLKTLILRGVKNAGSYLWNNVAPFIEEDLTGAERDLVVGFLAWVVQGGRSAAGDGWVRTFGHGNIGMRWDEFLKATGRNVPRQRKAKLAPDTLNRQRQIMKMALSYLLSNNDDACRAFNTDAEDQEPVTEIAVDDEVFLPPTEREIQAMIDNL